MRCFEIQNTRFSNSLISGIRCTYLFRRGGGKNVRANSLNFFRTIIN